MKRVGWGVMLAAFAVNMCLCWSGLEICNLCFRGERMRNNVSPSVKEMAAGRFENVGGIWHCAGKHQHFSRPIQ